MPGLVLSPSTPTSTTVPVGKRLPRWRATVMKVVVLLVNGYFLLGMGDCNGGGKSSIHGTAPAGPTLSALTLSAGVLNPSFDPDVTSYDTMYIGDTSVTVTPTAADAGTTITVNGTPVTNGNASGAIALPSGNTTITLLLTGTDGLTNTYTITAHRLAQQAYVKASNTGAGDQLGYSIAVDGDTLVLGAPDEDGSGLGVNPTSNNLASNAGAAYVFVRHGTTWTQQAYLKASNTGANDRFGHSIAISGDTVVVGARLEDGGGTGVTAGAPDNSATGDGAGDSGAVYVFVRNGTTWIQQAYLKASNTGASDWFGSSVTISGDTVVVGAEGEDSSGTGINPTSNDGTANSGPVYVFVRSGTTWTQEAYIKASNTGNNDNFGVSVAIDGETLAVGALFEDSNAIGINGANNDSASNAGAVYVFTRSGTTWSQQAYVKASNTGANDLFGVSVALSGSTLAVGARSEASNATGINGADNDSASNSGAAYVFTRTGTTWSQQAYIKASNTQTGDNFGAAVDVEDDIVIVGTGRDDGGPFPSEDSSATGVNGDDSDNSMVDSGAAYVFRRVGSTWSQEAYVKASNTGSNDLFGTAVSVSGDTIAVGAYLEDSNATTINPGSGPGSGTEADNSTSNAGAVYVFQ